MNTKLRAEAKNDFKKDFIKPFSFGVSGVAYFIGRREAKNVLPLYFLNYIWYDNET